MRTIDEEYLSDDDAAAAMIDCCFRVEENDRFLVEDWHFYSRLIQCLSLLDESRCRLPLRAFMKYPASCLGTKLHRDVLCVLYRHWRLEGTLSADVDDEADVSLALQLANWSVMTGMGR